MLFVMGFGYRLYPSYIMSATNQEAVIGKIIADAAFGLLRNSFL
jgi:hypothetical protein